MESRPELVRGLDSKTFREYYYLKEELLAFCRANHLPVSGGKQELTERIACFLDTGEIREPVAKRAAPRKKAASEITRESIIEDGFVCTETHRAFFRKEIGNSFSFNVRFQQWLKANAGKTYDDAITAYYEIREAKKTGKDTIGKQFEYNTYVRDFFADNPGKTLEDAITCWKYKKGLKGHNRYERPDLAALDNGAKTGRNEEYICKIASPEEMNQKWDYEIRQHPETENWIIWKGEAIEGFQTGRSIPYYGVLDGTVICEATAVLCPDFPQNGLKTDEHAVELCAFRTIKAYRGKGYFSKLMRFMMEDLKEKGYTKAVVGVEPEEKLNKEIYHHWGFTELICTGNETYPDGTVIDVEFYGRQL